MGLRSYNKLYKNGGTLSLSPLPTLSLPLLFEIEFSRSDAKSIESDLIFHICAFLSLAWPGALVQASERVRFYFEF